jgi:homoserine dehydrogenase
MERRKIRIGLFGFGIVGQGLYDVLQQSSGLKTEIAKICVKDHNKKRTLPNHYFSYDKNELLNDDSINVIVELIDDASAAYDIVTAAIRKGKAVVTANKKLIAEHLDEIISLQKKFEVPVLYEAACCASLPVIRNLEEYYDNDLLQSVEGIVNGSTNFILSKMFDEKQSFHDALRNAQLNGFAESDPRLDVEGLDAKYKLCLLLLHAFGVKSTPDEIFNLGIQHIGDIESRYATEKGLRIKLIARAHKIGDEIAAFVAPQFVSKRNRLYWVSDEYNGLVIESCFADKQFFEGKGAGSHPTASAVLSDLSALTYDYRYEYKKVNQHSGLKLTNDFYSEIFISFDNNAGVGESDFIEVRERYYSRGKNFIVGKIHFEKLIRSEWLRNVSLVFTEKAIVEEFAEAY